jgi:predicted transcriptional regulator
LQHHFTRLKIAQSQVQNEKFFRSILAKEIMSLDPVCMEENNTIGDAVEVFIKNKIHAIIVCREGKICGIVTPIDILKSVVYPALIDK